MGSGVIFELHMCYFFFHVEKKVGNSVVVVNTFQRSYFLFFSCLVHGLYRDPLIIVPSTPCCSNAGTEPEQMALLTRGDDSVS